MNRFSQSLRRFSRRDLEQKNRSSMKHLVNEQGSKVPNQIVRSSASLSCGLGHDWEGNDLSLENILNSESLFLCATITPLRQSMAIALARNHDSLANYFCQRGFPGLKLLAV